MNRQKRNTIIITVIILLFIIGALIYGRIFWFFEVLESIQSFIVYKFDINKNIVLFLSIPIALIYFKFGVLNLTSFKKSNQWTGLYVHSAFMMLFYLGMFLFPRNSVFNPITGESLKCFSRYEGKLYEAECDWKVHEKYGTPILNASPELIIEWEKQEKLNKSKSPNDPYKVLEQTESEYNSLKE